MTRSWVYASAKRQNNYVGFGSQVDHDERGRMHIVPSIYPTLQRNGSELPMPRLIVLYAPPEDPDVFDAHYRDVHTAIVARSLLYIYAGEFFGSLF